MLNRTLFALLAFSLLFAPVAHAQNAALNCTVVDSSNAPVPGAAALLINVETGVSMNALGIKLICDFRTDGERQRQPTQWQGGPAPEMMRAQIMKDADVKMSIERVRELTSRATAASSLSTAYDSMVTPDAAAEYGRLYKRIAAGQFPVIAHCSAGKDRTGVFSAVLLTLLGVPRSSVIEDYMLTGEYMTSPRALRQAATDMQKTLGSTEGLDAEAVRAIYTMHAEVLTNTFATIDRQYGSFDGFVRDALKLSAGEVNSLRSRLLQ